MTKWVPLCCATIVAVFSVADSKADETSRSHSPDYWVSPWFMPWSDGLDFVDRYLAGSDGRFVVEPYWYYPPEFFVLRRHPSHYYYTFPDRYYVRPSPPEPQAELYYRSRPHQLDIHGYREPYDRSSRDYVWLWNGFYRLYPEFRRPAPGEFDTKDGIDTKDGN